ncbi:uncharacterized protein LJ206_010001 [Theristicus caerulescens]
MDVKPRPLSCMKKLSLTCEIKLQIHRPGIEETLPAGPREAGSSPAGRWQGSGEAPGQPRCRGRAAGRSRPAARRGPGRGLCPEPAWPCSRWGDRGEALGPSEKVLQGEGGSGAGSRAGRGGDGRPSRAASRHLPEERGQEGNGGAWTLLGGILEGARDTSASPVATPVLGRRGRRGPAFPLLRGRRAPAPPRSQLAAGAAGPRSPRRACLAKALCHRAENETLPEARSAYKRTVPPCRTAATSVDRLRTSPTEETISAASRRCLPPAAPASPPPPAAAARDRPRCQKANPGHDPSLVFPVPSRKAGHKPRHRAQALPAASRTAPLSLPSLPRLYSYSLQICIIPAQAKNNISPLHAHFIPNYHSSPLRHKEFPRPV